MDGLDAEHGKRAAARKQTRGTRAGREMLVCFQYGAEPGFFLFAYFVELDEIAVEDLVGFATENVGEAAGHTGAEVEADGAEDEGDAAGHIFTAVLADAFDDGEGAAVADGEAFAGPACYEELAGSGAVKNRVSSEDVAATRGSGTGGDGDGAAGKAFADVIVGLAEQRQRDSFGEESAETLACAAAKFFRQILRELGALVTGTAAAHEFAAHASAYAAVGILDGLRFGLELEGGFEVQSVFPGSGVECGRLVGCDAIGIGNRDNQKRINAGAGAEAVVPASEFAEGADTELRKAVADFFSERAEISDDHFGLAVETSTELFVLRRDPDGAGVEMALAGHDAADGEERGGAEAEFVGAEKSANDDVAREFQAAVNAKRDAGAEAGADERVVCFAQTDFPRKAGVFDRG